VIVDSTRTDRLKRRIYVAALAVATPIVPVIGWVQRGHEDGAVVVYGVMTLTLAVTLAGLLARRLSLVAAERTVLVVVVASILTRLARAVFVLDLAPDEVRRLVTETVGPTLVTVVLILYLAMDTRRGLRWALALWATFTAMLAPVIVAAATSDPTAAIALVRQALVVGAVVALASGLAALKAQLAEESARARALGQLASTDPLTGIHNRRGVEAVLREQLARLARYGGDLVVGLVDLDRFKDLNDQHGHAAGDEALVAVVTALRAGLRVTDALGRWGGDELLVVAPATPLAEAQRSAERWRDRIAALELPAGPGHLTCSIGVVRAAPGDTVETLLARADRALYRAKRAGGDQIATDDAGPTPPAVATPDGLPVG
jgi:diguanylate cyclase (GGDEF)-like protein